MRQSHLNPALFAALGLIAILAVLQTSLVSHFAIGGFWPDLVLLAVINWGLIRGVEEGMLCGLVGGVIIDLTSGLPFGTSSVAYVCVAGVVSLGESALMRTHILLPTIAALVGTIIYFCVAIVIVASINHEVLLNGSVGHTILGVAVYNAVINPLVYLAAHALDRTLHPVVRTSW